MHPLGRHISPLVFILLTLNLCELMRLSSKAQGGSQKNDAIKIQISCQYPVKTQDSKLFPFSLVKAAS